MKDKNIIIAAIALVAVMLIIIGVVSINLRQARQEVRVLKTVILKKNIEIENLTKQLTAKQGELNRVKTELDDVNKRLDNIKKELDNTAKKPVAPPSKAGKR